MAVRVIAAVTTGGRFALPGPGNAQGAAGASNAQGVAPASNVQSIPADQSGGHTAQVLAQVDTGSCFLLYDVGAGMRRREPSRACSWRLSPASTFKVPHAIAALDAGVVSVPDEVIPFDGTGNWPALSRHDHTLTSAIPYSVVWYFQRLATRLGLEREQAYLSRLDFGNADPSSGLTTF